MIGKKIKELRQEKNIYQQDLANELNVSKSTVAMWETEKRTPDTDMLKKIAQYFNVSIDYLLDNEKRPPKDSESLDDVYFSLAKELQDGEIDPDDIRLALETIKNMKNRKASD